MSFLEEEILEILVLEDQSTSKKMVPGPPGNSCMGAEAFPNSKTRGLRLPCFKGSPSQEKRGRRATGSQLMLTPVLPHWSMETSKRIQTWSPGLVHAVPYTRHFPFFPSSLLFLFNRPQAAQGLLPWASTAPEYHCDSTSLWSVPSLHCADSSTSLRSVPSLHCVDSSAIPCCFGGL